MTSASASFCVTSRPCEAASTSTILAESYSFIWQPWVLMKSLPDIARTDAEGDGGELPFYGYVVVRARFFGVFASPASIRPSIGRKEGLNAHALGKLFFLSETWIVYLSCPMKSRSPQCVSCACCCLSLCCGRRARTRAAFSNAPDRTGRSRSPTRRARSSIANRFRRTRTRNRSQRRAFRKIRRRTPTTAPRRAIRRSVR